MIIADQPKTDAEWQAQCDAETLATAEEIKTDEARLKAAEVQATKMAEDKDEQAKAMRKVAGSGTDAPERKRTREGDLSGTGNPFNVGARLR